MLFTFLLFISDSVFGQLVPKEVMISDNELPPTWKDTLVKKGKWMWVEDVQILKRKMGVSKLDGDYYQFSDTAIDMFFSTTGKFHYPYFKYFPNQNSFAVAKQPITNWHFNPGTEQHG